VTAYERPTTQGLNIPDPPDDVDSQMAAGFNPGSVMTTFAQMAHPAAADTAAGIGAAGLMPRPSSSVQCSMDEVAGTAVGWTGRAADDWSERSGPSVPEGSNQADPTHSVSRPDGRGEIGGAWAGLAAPLLAAGIGKERGRTGRDAIPARRPFR
jgi:hypothetical protein